MELIKKEGAAETFELTQRLAKAMVMSGYFKGVKDVAAGFVKIQAGAELGMGPVASMMGLYDVQGKLGYSAFYMQAVAGKHGYTFRAKEHSDKTCTVSVFKHNEKLGDITFNMQDAATAGLLSNPSWKKYPKNMLWARAVSNACRWYCADAFGGVTPYTPEELGAEVDERGDMLNVTPSAAPTQAPETKDLNDAMRQKKPTKAVKQEAFFEESSNDPAGESSHIIQGDHMLKGEAVASLGTDLLKSLKAKKENLTGLTTADVQAIVDELAERDAIEKSTSAVEGAER